MSYNPVIILPGIGQSKVNVVDANGNKIKSAWPVELDEKALLNDIKGSLMKMMIFKKDSGFSDKVAKIVGDVADPLSLNDDGTKKNNVKTVEYNKPVSECTPDEKRYIYKMVPMEQLGKTIGEDKLFFFAFDPFGDVDSVSDDLDKFVSMVKDKTGCDKVNFLCVSLGGIILRGYLRKYAEKGDVEKVLNIVAALDGTQFVADIFEDKINIGDPAEMLKSMGGKAASMASMVGMLPGEVITATIDKSLATAKEKLLYNSTMMWAAVPNDRFDAVYDKCLKGKGKPILEEKVTAFRTYTKNFVDETKALEAKGVSFYQLCGYDNEMLSIFPSKCISSDRIINLASSSMAENDINAGDKPQPESCAFPNRTWFFKNQFHDDIAYNDVALSLAFKILTDEIADVDSDSGYPQFNGTRNIKKLKYKLIPEAEKAGLTSYIDEYNELLADTVIENNDKVKDLEKRLSSALEEKQ